MDFTQGSGPQKITHFSQLPIDEGQPVIRPTMDLGDPTGLKTPRGPIGVDTTYKPLDAFPNPYGMGPKAEIDFTQPLQQASPPPYQQLQSQQQPSYQPPPPQAFYDAPPPPMIQLPSHDIPVSPLAHQIDERLQPNYIPPPKITKDYIREYEQTVDKETERSAKEYLEKKKHKTQWERWFESFQFPLAVALLYYLFHTASFQSLMYKKIGFLPITSEDGQLNIYGLSLTAGLFGCCVYVMKGLVDYLQNSQ